MTFRQRVYLRVALTVALAVVLTGITFSLATNAQDFDAGPPLFIMTDQAVYAVYPSEDRQVPLDIPGRQWNMVLSPDGTSLLVDSQPDDDLPGLDFYTVDVETLEIRPLPLRDGGVGVSGMPVWRWDSGALLYTEFDADRISRVVEYTLEDGQRTVRADDLLSGGDLETSGVPLTVYWSPEAFALLHYDDEHKAHLLRYDSSGTALPPILLFDPLNPENPDSLSFDNLIHVVSEDGDLLGVRRPGIKRWEVIDVLSGEITRLDEGMEIVKAPAGVSSPRFVMTFDDATLFPPIHNLATLINGQRSIVLPEPKSVLTVSPDGEGFAVADADGFAVSDGTNRIPVNLPPDDLMLTWRVAWAPLEGRIESIGRFRLEGDGLLVLLGTPGGDLPIAYSDDMRLAPDGESIVWVSRGVNNEAQVMRYDWRTHETTYLFSGEVTDTMPPLPAIVDYDGKRVTLDGEEGRFTIELDDNLTGIDSAKPPPTFEAALDMPLYFFDTLDCLNRWTASGGITDEMCPSEHGGTRYFGMSPDASKLVWVWLPGMVGAPYQLNWTIISTQGFERIAGFGSSLLDGEPVWRWDNNVIAWATSDRLVGTPPVQLEYDLSTGEQNETQHYLPRTEDARGYGVIELIWWTEETIGVRYDSAASGETTLMVYLPNGDPMLQMLISTLNNEPDSTVSHILPLAGAGEAVAALYYPDRGEWMLLTPQTAELNPPPDGFTIAEAPAATVTDPHYCRTIYDVREPQQVILCETGEPVLAESAARVEISPDGNYYAYATPDGIYVGGVDMAETMIYANERQNPMDDPWLMAWSATVGRLVPDAAGSAGRAPETPVSIEGTIYQTFTIDESTELHVTVDWGSEDNNYRRVDRIYLLDTATQSLTKLLETDSMILEGPVALTPDRQTVLLSTYSDETGAAIWRLDVPQGGAPATDPVMLANGLLFWADAGNFALPSFVEVTDETFTVSTFGLDWSGEEPRELGDLITYSLDGELLHSEPKPTPAGE